MFGEGMAVTQKELSRSNIGIHSGGLSMNVDPQTLETASFRLEDPGRAVVVRVPNARDPIFSFRLCGCAT
jgi:hypothetical protein